MSDFKVNRYDAIKVEARYVSLWWNEITGRHDADAGGGVLYIGHAQRLDQRVLISSEAHLFEIHEEQGEQYVRMTADAYQCSWEDIHKHPPGPGWPT